MIWRFLYKKIVKSYFYLKLVVRVKIKQTKPRVFKAEFMLSNESCRATTSCLRLRSC